MKNGITGKVEEVKETINSQKTFAANAKKQDFNHKEKEVNPDNSTFITRILSM